MIEIITREDFFRNINKESGYINTFLSESPKMLIYGNEKAIVPYCTYLYLRIHDIGYAIYIHSINLLIQFKDNDKLLSEEEFNNIPLSLDNWDLAYISDEISVDYTLNVFKRLDTYFAIEENYILIKKGTWNLQNNKTGETFNIAVRPRRIPYRDDNWFEYMLAFDEKLIIPINANTCKQKEELFMYLLYLKTYDDRKRKDNEGGCL